MVEVPGEGDRGGDRCPNGARANETRRHGVPIRAPPWSSPAPRCGRRCLSVATTRLPVPMLRAELGPRPIPVGRIQRTVPRAGCRPVGPAWRMTFPSRPTRPVRRTRPAPAAASRPPPGRAWEPPSWRSPHGGMPEPARTEHPVGPRRREACGSCGLSGVREGVLRSLRRRRRSRPRRRARSRLFAVLYRTLSRSRVRSSEHWFGRHRTRCPPRRNRLRCTRSIRRSAVARLARPP